MSPTAEESEGWKERLLQLGEPGEAEAKNSKLSGKKRRQALPEREEFKDGTGSHKARRYHTSPRESRASGSKHGEEADAGGSQETQEPQETQVEEEASLWTLGGREVRVKVGMVQRVKEYISDTWGAVSYTHLRAHETS